MSTNTDPTYTLDVTPTFGPDLLPVYDAVIYENRPAGVCGPFANATYDNLDDLLAWAVAKGFTVTGPFGDLCANGFATAPLTYVGFGG